MKRIWFKRKRYGWGWTPSTWQGWVVTLGYIIVLYLLSFVMDIQSVTDLWLQFIIPFLILTIVFILIVVRFGESPRWQWGKDRGDNIES